MVGVERSDPLATVLLALRGLPPRGSAACQCGKALRLTVDGSTLMRLRLPRIQRGIASSSIDAFGKAEPYRTVGGKAETVKPNGRRIELFLLG
jgi:hypothetical protein